MFPFCYVTSSILRWAVFRQGVEESQIKTPKITFLIKCNQYLHLIGLLYMFSYTKTPWYVYHGWCSLMMLRESHPSNDCIPLMPSNITKNKTCTNIKNSASCHWQTIGTLSKIRRNPDIRESWSSDSSVFEWMKTPSCSYITCKHQHTR